MFTEVGKEQKKPDVRILSLLSSCLHVPRASASDAFCTTFHVQALNSIEKAVSENESAVENLETQEELGFFLNSFLKFKRGVPSGSKFLFLAEDGRVGKAGLFQISRL